MKTSLRLAVVMTILLFVKQPLSAQFVKSVGGTGADYGQAIAYDAAGNSYIIGDFRGKADFDPGPGTLILKSSCPCDESNPLLPDIFFAKYSKNGALIWAKQIGGGGYDYGKAIGVDAAGNVYITGSFENTVDFDPSAGVVNLIAAGGKDTYLAKYTPNGNYVWAEKTGSGGYDESNSLWVNSAGVVTIAGYFGGVVDFDPSPATVSYDAGSSSDPFFARYATDGSLVWAKDISGNGESSAEHVFVDSTGNIYLSGNFFGTADFNTGAGIFNLTGAGSKDPFYAKYTSTGDFVWAASVGGGGDETGQSIIADKAGNVYATGYYIGTVDFNPGAGVFNLSSGPGFFNAYLLKLNKDGVFAWANNIGGTQNDIGLSLALDAQQNIYVTGYFSGIASFSSTQSLTSSGSTDIFIAAYKGSGTLFSLFKEGGVTDDWASCIAIDAKGFLYVTGYYTGNAQFTINGSTTTLTSAGNADVYFMKAKRNSLQPVAALTSTESLVTTKAIDDNKVMLYQNAPNPVMSQTNIGYYLPALTKVRLSIMDINGKEVMLLKNGTQDKGAYTIQLSAANLSSGVYVYRLQANNEIITKKMIVNK